MKKVILSVIFLALSLAGCAANRSSFKDDPHYHNDFFGLAIKAADHESGFDILEYGPNGVKYEFHKNKMDRSVTAYGRIETKAKEKILWLGIQNNEAEALQFSRKEDQLQIRFTDQTMIELDGKKMEYIDGAKKIKAGETQLIKIPMKGDLSGRNRGDFEEMVLAVASNFPEIIVFKQLPAKTFEKVIE